MDKWRLMTGIMMAFWVGMYMVALLLKAIGTFLE